MIVPGDAVDLKVDPERRRATPRQSQRQPLVACRVEARGCGNQKASAKKDRWFRRSDCASISLIPKR